MKRWLNKKRYLVPFWIQTRQNLRERIPEDGMPITRNMMLTYADSFENARRSRSTAVQPRNWQQSTAKGAGERISEKKQQKGKR
jgi:hypothetical protein